MKFSTLLIALVLSGSVFVSLGGVYGDMMGAYGLSSNVTFNEEFQAFNNSLTKVEASINKVNDRVVLIAEKGEWDITKVADVALLVPYAAGAMSAYAEYVTNMLQLMMGLSIPIPIPGWFTIAVTITIAGMILFKLLGMFTRGASEI